MNAGQVYLSSDNDVILPRLTDDGTPVTAGATVRFTLYAAGNVPVAANVAMSASGIAGDWKGRLEDTIAATLKRNGYYKIVVVIDYGDDHIEVEREFQAVAYQGS